MQKHKNVLHLLQSNKINLEKYCYKIYNYINQSLILTWYSLAVQKIKTCT